MLANVDRYEGDAMDCERSDSDDDGAADHYTREQLRKWGVVTGYLLDWARELGDVSVLEDKEKEAA